MSVSLGPFMTCFVTILILTGYVHFIMKRNSALFRGTIKIVFGVIAVILLRMMVPINFPFTKTIYSSKLLIGLGNIVYANVYGDREILVSDLLLWLWISVAVILLIRYFHKRLKVRQYLEQYIIKGGNPLVGEVEIGGAKNAALAILAAAIMTDETVQIDNLPDVNDVNVMLEAIEGIGAMVQRIDRHTVKINGSTIGDFNIEYDYIKKIRASYYLLGALLGKYKRAEVALPGGCNIGSRPIDQHLKGFRALGADVDIEHGKIVAEAEKLRGTHLYFDVVTVGATINVMMAAAMSEGLTIMENVAKEPHVVDVANFLNSMGANIRGAGTDVIKIRGVRSLHKTEYSIIPDQIEAGTFMFAAAATKGDVTVLNVIPKHLDATISKLVDIGCEVEEFDDAVRVVAKKRLRCTQVKTLPYPGYPTDMQPQIGVALALAKGTSTITESIFENRFKYLGELARMGAQVKVEGNSATIEGVERFSAARVSAPDLRAGAALCIAGLAAEGITIVDDIVYIQRGYERFEEKLRGLGAMIERVSSEKEIQKFKLKVG